MTTKKNNKFTMKDLLDELKIDETFTKKRFYKFDKFKENTFPKANYNEMCDLLMLPETKEGYKYLFCVCDLWSNYCDFEPMKTKTAKETLSAMLKCFKRNYVKLPKASMKSDNGGEFKEQFEKYLYDHHIAHPTCYPDRHKQLANIENLNKQIGRLLMTYLTNKEKQLKKPYSEWTDIIPQIREGLNKVKKHPPDKDPYTCDLPPLRMEQLPKYKIGDIVYRPLETPKGNLHDKRFRSGDNRYDDVPRKVKFVLAYPNNWRYILDGFPNVSYAENELIKSLDEEEEKWEVKKIIGERVQKKQKQFLVWWKYHKKDQSTWEDEKNLKEDLGDEVLNEFIKEYKDSLKKKKPKKK